METNDVSRREVLAGAGAGLGALTVGAGRAAGAERTEYNVGTASAAAERAAKNAADRVDRVLDWGDGEKTITATLADEAADELRDRPGVRYVETDGEMRAIAQTLPWGIDRVDAEKAHGAGYTGGDGDAGDSNGAADVAVIDTGIDSDHPDLEANLEAGKAYVDCKGGPGVDCLESWDDDEGHGTHCAGIADAIDNTEGVVGVSTAATLHAVKVLDNSGSGSYSDVAAGIKYVADQGWDVGSLSLGGGKSSTVEDACEYAYGNGVLLVAAAGNDGPCTDCVSYPAAEPEVVAVSATGKDDGLASYSSTGSEVELAAPGSDVYSTYVGGGYEYLSGTSMACPHVSGAGGQLMDDGYTNTEARDQLNSTAEDIGLASNEQGNGLLDVEAALGLAELSVDSLSASEVETSDGDAEFDADWSVSDPDGDLSSVELVLYDTNTDSQDDSATVSVSGDTASGTTRLVASSDEGDEHTYEITATVTDEKDNTAAETVKESETEDAPTVDSLSASEVETSDGDAEFDADWSVSDADGDLDAVDLTLTDDTDGETEDTASVEVDGDTDSGTTRLIAAGDDGSGNGYTVEATVSDTNGSSDSATTSVSETEDTSSAPAVDSLSLSEDNSGGSPHAEFAASWSVSDDDGDLDTVDLTLYELDSNGNRVQTEDSASVDVSGGSASGTTGLKAKFDENSGHTYEVELVVADANGNTASDTATEVEDGS